MPTADVVSKGEVAGAVEKLMDATDKMISEVKVETAREIFEELETVFCYSVYPRVNRNGTITPVRSHHWHIRPDDYNAIKKKYTEGD